MLVVDASVAVKWLIEEEGTADAEALPTADARLAARFAGTAEIRLLGA